MKWTPDTRLAEVRRRMIIAFQTSTNADAPQWWACHICSWTWKDGEQELHEPTCPLGR